MCGVIVFLRANIAEYSGADVERRQSCFDTNALNAQYRIMIMSHRRRGLSGWERCRIRPWCSVSTAAEYQHAEDGEQPSCAEVGAFAQDGFRCRLLSLRLGQIAC